MYMEEFKKLKVWLKAHKLVLEVYKITKDFPKDELYCLVSQMRRAAISVVANIVEGSKRVSNKDRLHFHVMANASLEELKYYFLLSYELKYINKEKGEELTNQAREVGRMLTGLSKSIKNNNA
ncbi:four helix bundle protein [Patescibacteria group bacterium]|nr:four helix bundle protein [Patescibacteria group bacterium]